MSSNQHIKEPGFMSVTLASQRMQSALSTPVRHISRSVANSAARMLQISGKLAERRLADVSRKIAGPVAFKLHHDFLMSRDRSNVSLVVGGQSLGYPRAAHAISSQPVLGGSRLRASSYKTTQIGKLQGGAATKATKIRFPRTSSLPGGRGLGRQQVPTAIAKKVPLPSAVRFVSTPSSYAASPIQGGKTQTAVPFKIQGRKNIPGGANLGIKQQAFPIVKHDVQGGAGLLNKQPKIAPRKVAKAAKQGGASQQAKSARGIERNGKIGGMGLGKRARVASVAGCPRQAGAQMVHKVETHQILASPIQGGPSLFATKKD